MLGMEMSKKIVPFSEVKNFIAWGLLHNILGMIKRGSVKKNVTLSFISLLFSQA